VSGRAREPLRRFGERSASQSEGIPVACLAWVEALG